MILCHSYTRYNVIYQHSIWTVSVRTSERFTEKNCAQSRTVHDIERIKSLYLHNGENRIYCCYHIKVVNWFLLAHFLKNHFIENTYPNIHLRQLLPGIRILPSVMKSIQERAGYEKGLAGINAQMWIKITLFVPIAWLLYFTEELRASIWTSTFFSFTQLRWTQLQRTWLIWFWRKLSCLKNISPKKKKGERKKCNYLILRLRLRRR